MTVPMAMKGPSFVFGVQAVEACRRKARWFITVSSFLLVLWRPTTGHATFDETFEHRNKISIQCELPGVHCQRHPWAVPRNHRVTWRPSSISGFGSFNTCAHCPRWSVWPDNKPLDRTDNPCQCHEIPHTWRRIPECQVFGLKVGLMT